MTALPPPTTTVELYLAAILEELRAMRNDHSAPPVAPSDLIELREPQRAATEPQRTSVRPAGSQRDPRRNR